MGLVKDSDLMAAAALPDVVGEEKLGRDWDEIDKDTYEYN